MLNGDARDLLAPEAPIDSRFEVEEQQAAAKLDQNEAAEDLPPMLRQQLLDSLASEPLNRYPQPRRYRQIKSRFAAAVGHAPERVVLTAGCDQLIHAAFCAAGGPGRPARIFEPTYPLYGHFARLTHTPLRRVLLGPDRQPATTDVLDVDDRLLALVTPNNPTGQTVDAVVIEAALSLPRLVLVDEAYIDFSNSRSCAELLDGHSNLLVGRSLSKCVAAGVRLGYGLGHPHLIEALEQLLFAPYHLNALQLAVAAHFDTLADHIAARAKKVRLERERITDALAACDVRVWPSEANFVLFSPGCGARAAHHRLLQRGVRVRDVSALPGLGDHLRATIGTQEENDRFLEAVAELSPG